MRIATKLALLLLLASLMPLVLFGLISLRQVRLATMVSVTQGNVRVARRAAEEINQYVTNGIAILESTAENISHADLQDWQKERILKNYINRFDEFNALSIRGVDGKLNVTSELEAKDMTPQESEVFGKALKGETALSPVYIKEDLTPAMAVGIPIRRLTEINGVLLAELNLLHMWYLVDSIKIGEHGVVHVLDAENRLIATGSGERKKDVFQHKSYESPDILSEALQPSGAEFINPRGVKVLAVGTRLDAPLQWTVLVAQSTSEAYALAYRMTYLLVAVMGGIILGAIFWGYYGGRRQVVDPIRVLSQATEELARGNLAYRVSLETGDEFTALGQAFNQMAIRIKEVQEKLLLEERHSMFGRIASGLAHDLKHPFQAIQNVSRLMGQMHEDADFRETFRRTVEREFAKISVFLQNLHNLTHEVPYQPMEISLNAMIRDVWETFELEAKQNKVDGAIELPAGDVRVMADRVALNRVFSNLISNAIQAMPSGGALSVRLSVVGQEAVTEVKDSGVGIPPERVPTLFDDFVTTKRRGLGLGLAIVRKIVQQHGGEITVSSVVGKGACFTVRIPLVKFS